MLGTLAGNALSLSIARPAKNDAKLIAETCNQMRVEPVE